MRSIELEPIKRTTLTVEECATYLGISKELVYILVRESKIRHFRIGRRILFRERDLNEWIEGKLISGLDDNENK